MQVDSSIVYALVHILTTAVLSSLGAIDTLQAFLKLKAHPEMSTPFVTVCDIAACHPTILEVFVRLVLLCATVVLIRFRA